MRQAATLTFLLFFTITSIAQITTNSISRYEFPKEMAAVKLITIAMPYASADVLSVEGDTTSLGNAGDILIEIICTDFPATASLSKLNSQRLQQFYKLFPYIKSNAVQQIKILRQMDGAQKDIAQNMFHGLIVKFRPAQTKETMISDINELELILGRIERDTARTGNINLPESKKIIAEKKPALKLNTSEREVTKPIFGDSMGGPKRVKEKKWTQAEIDSIRLIEVKSRPKAWQKSYSMFAGAKPYWFIEYGHDSICHLIISPKEALRLGYLSRRDYKKDWKRNELITIIACIYKHSSDSAGATTAYYPLRLDSAAITEYASDTGRHVLPDSTLFKIFKRNKWTGMDIVGDVTGSMYPYTAQLLLWLKLQSLDSLTTHYSFFNDGDDLPNRKKIMGKTGGIYSAECTSFSEVVELVKSTMMKGGGGDCPENNVEAILQSEKKFPATAFHVLIADNWAPIKDMPIAQKITKPVRIVLCGVMDDAINIDYLNLARKTGGSVHLMEKDLLNLAAMHEGETITIGKKKFRIINGQFKDISGHDQLSL